MTRGIPPIDEPNPRTVLLLAVVEALIHLSLSFKHDAERVCAEEEGESA